MASLDAAIAADDAFFARLVTLVPPELYYPVTDEEKELQWLQRSRRSRFTKNRKDAAPKQGVKEKSKKGKRAKFAALGNGSAAAGDDDDATMDGGADADTAAAARAAPPATGPVDTKMHDAVNVAPCTRLRNDEWPVLLRVATRSSPLLLDQHNTSRSFPVGG